MRIVKMRAHTNNSIHINTIVRMIAFMNTIVRMRKSMNTILPLKFVNTIVRMSQDESSHYIIFMTVLSRREKQSYIEQALGKTEIKTILPIAPRSRAMRKAIRIYINKSAILLNIQNPL